LAIAFILLLLLALLGGCASNATPPAGDGAVSQASTPAPVFGTQNKTDNFGWALGAGAPGQGGPQFMSKNAASFTLQKGTTTLTVTSSWTCATPSCTLRLELYAPGTGPGSTSPTAVAASTEGPSPLIVAVNAPADGEWVAALFPTSPDSAVAGTIALSAVGSAPAET